MRGLTRYDRILAGTALALILALPSGVLAETPSAIDAAVPMPEATALPPPDRDDVSRVASQRNAASRPPPPFLPQRRPHDHGRGPCRRSPPRPTVAAPAEAPPPDPLAALDPADRPIAEKMRDLLAGQGRQDFRRTRRSTPRSRPSTRTAHCAPLWVDKGVVNARAKAVIARLQASDADGLDPKDYKIPDLDRRRAPTRWPKPSSS